MHNSRKLKFEPAWQMTDLFDPITSLLFVPTTIKIVKYKYL